MARYRIVSPARQRVRGVIVLPYDYEAPIIEGASTWAFRDPAIHLPQGVALMELPTPASMMATVGADLRSTRGARGAAATEIVSAVLGGKAPRRKFWLRTVNGAPTFLAPMARHVPASNPTTGQVGLYNGMAGIAHHFDSAIENYALVGSPTFAGALAPQLSTTLTIPSARLWGQNAQIALATYNLLHRAGTLSWYRSLTKATYSLLFEGADNISSTMAKVVGEAVDLERAEGVTAFLASGACVVPVYYARALKKVLSLEPYKTIIEREFALAPTWATSSHAQFVDSIPLPPAFNEAIASMGFTTSRETFTGLRTIHVLPHWALPSPATAAAYQDQLLDSDDLDVAWIRMTQILVDQYRTLTRSLANTFDPSTAGARLVKIGGSVLGWTGNATPWAGMGLYADRLTLVGAPIGAVAGTIHDGAESVDDLLAPRPSATQPIGSDGFLCDLPPGALTPMFGGTDPTKTNLCASAALLILTEPDRMSGGMRMYNNYASMGVSENRVMLISRPEDYDNLPQSIIYDPRTIQVVNDAGSIPQHSEWTAGTSALELARLMRLRSADQIIDMATANPNAWMHLGRVVNGTWEPVIAACYARSAASIASVGGVPVKMAMRGEVMSYLLTPSLGAGARTTSIVVPEDQVAWLVTPATRVLQTAWPATPDAQVLGVDPLALTRFGAS